MDVARELASTLIAHEAAQGDLLADRRRRVRDERGDLLAVDLARVERVEILRRRLSDMLRDLRLERLELLVARSEVRLAVDLDEHADLRVLRDVRCDCTLCCDAAGLLLRLGDALLAQPVDGCLRIAVRRRQCFLAVHHARARLLAQLFYHCSRNCHCISSLSYLSSKKRGKG